MPTRQELIVSSTEINEATDKIILPQSFLDSILREYNNRDLPYPITLSVQAQGRKTHVGVREFSVDEGSVILPTVVLDNLAVKSGMPVSVALVDLEKGESVKLRPLASGYDLNQDWKVALEGAFRSTYTTLTKGDVIRLRSGMRFLVDDLAPKDAVCIVDTDLEVDLEPLSEEQALATVQANAVSQSSNQAIPLQIGQTIESAIDDQNYFVLQEWDRAGPIIIKVDASHADVDLLVTMGDDRPTLDSSVWSNLNSRNQKIIEVESTNAAIESGNNLRISLLSSLPARYTLLVTQSRVFAGDENPSIGEDETKCQNCLAVVPKRSLVLHERHCQRNNSRCPHADCNFIFRRGLDTNHWHCTTCGHAGEGSLDLHMTRFHPSSPIICECQHSCPDVPSLAHHRATYCPEKSIICQFCHLRVSQGDASDLSYQDRAQHFTSHESSCGSRTTECDTCHGLVKLKDLSTHLKIHGSQRLQHRIPEICSNQNCVQKRGSNSMSLCDECFGPLYSTQEDQDGSKLIARIKRRYATQLVSGCRHTYCNNRLCATATGQKLGYAQALKKADDETSRQGTAAAAAVAWFCVSESLQKKRTVAEVLECEGNYDLRWCCRAIDVSHGDLMAARAWLNREAVTKNEEAQKCINF